MDNSKAIAIATLFSQNVIFLANTKIQLVRIDFQLQKSRASAIMVLHSQ